MTAEHDQRHPPDDPAIRDEELSRIYRQGAREESPVALDEAILAASRRAVRSRPRPASGPFSGRWTVAVSLAAMLVLSVGLVTVFYRDFGVAPLTTPVQTPSPVVPTVTEAVEPDDAPQGRGTAADTLGKSVRRIAPAAPAPAPPARKKERTTLDESAATAIENGAGTAALRAVPTRRGTAPPRSQQEGIAYPAESAASGQSPQRLLLQQAAPANVATPMQGPGTPTSEPPAIDVAEESMTPAQRLDRIRALLTQERQEEARRALARLHARYPDYPLPEGMRALLEGSESAAEMHGTSDPDPQQ